MLIQNMQNSSNLMVPIKSYEPEKICPMFEKRGHIPKYQVIFIKISALDSAYQGILLYRFQAPMYKHVEFCIFCPDKDQGYTFI